MAYYLRLLKVIFSIRRSFLAVDSIAGLISIIGPAIVLWWIPTPASEEAARIVTDLAWQIPLGVLSLLTVVRIVLAPYWIAREETARRDAVEDELNTAIGDLEAQLGQKSKIFEVHHRTTSMVFNLNKGPDGAYVSSDAGMGINLPVLLHLDDLTTVTRVTAILQVVFTASDGHSWQTSKAIQFTPWLGPWAGPAERALTWDTSDPLVWALRGLPMVVGKDERISLPSVMMTVVDADVVGSLSDKGDTCVLMVKLAMRTDKGNPRLATQTIPLTRIKLEDQPWHRATMKGGTDETTR